VQFKRNLAAPYWRVRVALTVAQECKKSAILVMLDLPLSLYSLSTGTFSIACSDFPLRCNSMAGHIIHIGTDMCHRLAVLENAGYTVTSCASIASLRNALEEGESPDAVVMTETDSVSPREAVRWTRAHSRVPMVLFRETQRDLAEDGFELEDGFDLVIPVLHPPAAWLAEIAALIAKSRKARKDPADTGIHPMDFRSESARPRGTAVARQQLPAEDPAPRPRGRKSGKSNL